MIQLKKYNIIKNSYLCLYKFSGYDFPWNFDNNLTCPSDKNLKGPIKNVNYLECVSIFKQFLECLTTANIQEMEEFCEPYFLKCVQQKLAQMNIVNNKKIYCNNIHSKNTQVNLFNINNIFGVGLHVNRLKNDGLSQYRVIDSVIDNIPTKQIFHKRAQPNETAKIIVQYQIFITSDINIQFESNHKQEQNTNHILQLETEIIQSRLDDIHKQSVSLKNTKMENYKIGKKNLFITDFDDFLCGNPIIKNKIIL